MVGFQGILEFDTHPYDKQKSKSYAHVYLDIYIYMYTYAYGRIELERKISWNVKMTGSRIKAQSFP